MDITVHNDLSVECREIAYEDPDDSYGDKGEHGLMALLLLSHEPFEYKGIKISPCASILATIVAWTPLLVGLALLDNACLWARLQNKELSQAAISWLLGQPLFL
ncbi:hypothetical protein [Paenibacillus sp. FSL H8-0259]|uniref:hypothetical protein n=1 Tax=Paenibacillus sp. FSL H8-0259 TaxID=1920423 RepID=UPI0015C2DC7D|nr:hypothetical protein [Paenibacillus sp. FSL H8-0259]